MRAAPRRRRSCWCAMLRARDGRRRGGGRHDARQPHRHRGAARTAARARHLGRRRAASASPSSRRPTTSAASTTTTRSSTSSCATPRPAPRRSSAGAARRPARTATPRTRPSRPTGASSRSSRRPTTSATADDDSVTNVFLHDTPTGPPSSSARARDGSRRPIGDSRQPVRSAADGDGRGVRVAARRTSAPMTTTPSQDIFTRRHRAGHDHADQPGQRRPAWAPTATPSIRRSRRTALRIAFASNADNLYADDRDLYTNIFMSRAARSGS